MFDQIFPSQQVKRSVIISNKHGTRVAERLSTYDFKKLGHMTMTPSPLDRPRCPHKYYGLVLSLTSEIKVLSVLAKNSCIMEIELLP